jgi:hypothetical protein
MGFSIFFLSGLFGRIRAFLLISPYLPNLPLIIQSGKKILFLKLSIDRSGFQFFFILALSTHQVKIELYNRDGVLDTNFKFGHESLSITDLFDKHEL